jgi:hypothetical protein
MASTAPVCACTWCRPGCPPEWADKLEQRLTVAAATGAGSHVTGAAPMPLDDGMQRQLQAEAGIAPGQPGALLETQPAPDPQPAQLLDEQGLVVRLPDPLQVKGFDCSPAILSSSDHFAGRNTKGTIGRKGSHLPTICRWGGGRRGGRCGMVQTTCARSAAHPALAASQPWSGAHYVLYRHLHNEFTTEAQLTSPGLPIRTIDVSFWR